MVRTSSDEIALTAIPVFDAREGGPSAHARCRNAQVAAVLDASLSWLPAGRLLARIGDPLVRHWMKRSSSAYVADIDAIARLSPTPGVWLLHGAYLFGCTALIDEGVEGPRLRRTLDWPFPGLGRLAEVALQRGPAGDYLNVTWPGFAGVLTAVAPGRFAAAINQAPMRRLTDVAWLRGLDYAVNPVRAMLRSGREPPEHLLRRVFETCGTFEAACALLQSAPVARPVLFTLAGTRPGELVKIEREETMARVLKGAATVANAWREERRGWEGRVCGIGPPLDNNRRRRAALAVWLGREAAPLAWAQPPVTNAFTRLTVEMCAADATLLVAGWELSEHGNIERATDVLRLRGDTVETATPDDALRPVA